VPILNVDDNAPSRYLRSRILERAGFDVREADSAAQALETALGTPPELVLLDVALPDGDGFSVCERLKTMYPHVPVVMITSVYTTGNARREGFQVGADDYLLDPVEPQRLIDAVSRFLRPSRPSSKDEPPMVITDEHGAIISANAVAARLLHLSTRGLRDRNLLGFFAPNRDRVAAHMRRAARGEIVQLTTTIRPRDRKPFDARVDISAAPFERGGSLEWVLEPLRDGSR
jgi:DNA-binding response OmpR family regulator